MPNKSLYISLALCIINDHSLSFPFITLKTRNKVFTNNRQRYNHYDIFHHICHNRDTLCSISNLKSTITSTDTDQVLKSQEINQMVPEHFLNSNIYSHKTKIPREQIWERLLPTTLSTSSNGVDITTTFSNIDIGVHELINKCKLVLNEGNNSKEYKDTSNYLRECLHEFARMKPNQTYKVRIVSSRGKKGQKCPRWHSDHVSIRLILALHGSGVCYASTNNCDCDSDVNASNETNTKKANQMMEKKFSKSIQYFNTGDYVILMGKQWENCEYGNVAAIHRSPDIIPFQGRVLLTMDVVEDQ